MQLSAANHSYGRGPIGWEFLFENTPVQPMTPEQRAENDALIRQDTLEDARQNIVDAKVAERIANRLNPVAKATTWGSVGLGISAFVAGAASHPLAAIGCGLSTLVCAAFALAATHSQHQLREDAAALRAEAGQWIKNAPADSELNAYYPRTR